MHTPASKHRRRPRSSWMPVVLFVLTLNVLSSGYGADAEPASTAEQAWAVYTEWPFSAAEAKRRQEETAQALGIPVEKKIDLGNGVKLDLVLIPAGTFIMGTPEPKAVDEAEFQKQIITGQALLAVSAGALLVMLTVVLIRAIRQKRRPQLSLGRLVLVTVAAGGCVLSGMHWRHSVQSLAKAETEYEAAQVRYKAAESDEKPAHPVTLTKPFYMGKYEVTQEQYQSVIGSNPSDFKGKDNPVEEVSWDDAQAFCKKLFEQTKQSVCLPTEAEWEWACRTGTTTTYHSGDSEADLARVAWYGVNSKETTHPVGQKEANAFGLYDMHGNVWEWSADWYGAYPGVPVQDPTGADSGSYRVLRGGSWYINPGSCRSANRNYGTPGHRDGSIGYRVVMRVLSRTP